MPVVLTAQAAALVAAVLGVAWAAHRLGRTASWRARLRRAFRHPAVPWVAVLLTAAGGAGLALLPGRADMPRRYADYLPQEPVDGAGTWLDVALLTALTVLAVLAVGGGAVLAAVWSWLRFGGSPGLPGSLLRHGVPVVGGLLLVAGLVGNWVADRTEPASFGWFLYAPLSDASFAPAFVGEQPRTAHVIAVTLGLLGLGVLTATAAFRTGRRET